MNKNKIISKKSSRLTVEEKLIANETKISRTRIANMVRRKPEIKKQCCICKNENADILHNKYPKDPYIITFICKDCRLDKNKLAQAEKLRFDIRELMNKSKLSTKNFLIEDVKNLVENYLMEISSIQAYCKKVGISRHQFNKLIERYKDMYNDPSIRRKILNHANNVNRKILSEKAYERNRF